MSNSSIGLGIFTVCWLASFFSVSSEASNKYWDGLIWNHTNKPATLLLHNKIITGGICILPTVNCLQYRASGSTLMAVRLLQLPDQQSGNLYWISSGTRRSMQSATETVTINKTQWKSSQSFTYISGIAANQIRLTLDRMTFKLENYVLEMFNSCTTCPSRGAKYCNQCVCSSVRLHIFYIQSNFVISPHSVPRIFMARSEVGGITG